MKTPYRFAINKYYKNVDYDHGYYQDYDKDVRKLNSIMDSNTLFPGVLDRGTPLIIRENNRYIVIGIFHEHMQGPQLGQTGTDKDPGIFTRLDAETVDWITNYADWTQDSTCETFTSCSCGIPGKPPHADHWIMK